MKPKLKPRNHVAKATQSGAGKHSEHANRKKAEDKKADMYAAQALEHNELHAHFFGMPNVPLREIRNRLDPILRAHAVREILKDSKEDDDDGQG